MSNAFYPVDENELFPWHRLLVLLVVHTCSGSSTCSCSAVDLTSICRHLKAVHSTYLPLCQLLLLSTVLGSTPPPTLWKFLLSTPRRPRSWPRSFVFLLVAQNSSPSLSHRVGLRNGRPSAQPTPLSPPIPSLPGRPLPFLCVTGVPLRIFIPRLLYFFSLQGARLPTSSHLTTSQPQSSEPSGRLAHHARCRYSICENGQSLFFSPTMLIAARQMVLVLIT